VTLILTELSHLGIAMATDSAVTVTDYRSGVSWAVPSAAMKLQMVPYLNAGISCWGLGLIGTTRTDVWLADFIQRHDGSESIKALAEDLALELNSILGPSLDGNPRAGFHVAGFLRDEIGEAPSLFQRPRWPLYATGRTGNSSGCPHLQRQSRYTANAGPKCSFPGSSLDLAKWGLSAICTPVSEA